jgi:hypothetical protein
LGSIGRGWRGRGGGGEEEEGGGEGSVYGDLKEEGGRAVGEERRGVTRGGGRGRGEY